MGTSASGVESTERRAALLVLASLLAVSAAAMLRFGRSELIDDAYVSFRYAQNLVEGHGIVFNPGERVEGYTNFLWVLLVAAAMKVGLDPELAARVLGGAFALGTIVVIAGWPAIRGGPRWLTWLAPALLAGSPVANLWAVHGLETAMFTFWVTLGMRSAAHATDDGRWPGAAGLWFALATWTRPEGVLFFGATAVYGLVTCPQGAQWRLASFSAAYFALAGSFWLWRWSYYGYFLPNTFYAKVGASEAVIRRGVGYVAAFLLRPHALIFLLLLPAAARARVDRSIRYPLWMAAVTLAAVAALGGDSFPGFRFLVPICPVLYWLVQSGAAEVRERLPRLRAGLALALLAAVAAHLAALHSAAERERRGSDEFVARMRLVAEALRSQLPPTTKIALNPIGAVPYFSGLYAYDMIGLTDEHIAHTHPGNFGGGRAGHEKGDGRYMLERRPDLIFVGNVLTAARELEVSLALAMEWSVIFRTESELVTLPELGALYTRDALALADGSHVVFLRRRDFELPIKGASSRP